MAEAISIPAGALQSLLAEAVLTQISTEQRDDIVRQAVEKLVLPTKGQYGRDEPSPLTAAFNTAVRDLARELAKEMVTDNPEVRARVKAACLDGIEQALTHSAELNSGISDVVQAILRGDR